MLTYLQIFNNTLNLIPHVKVKVRSGINSCIFFLLLDWYKIKQNISPHFCLLAKICFENSGEL